MTVRMGAPAVTLALGMLLTGAGQMMSSGARAEKPSEAGAPAWELKGSRIIACCCVAPCPCRINKPPTNCHGCDASTVVRIESGQIGGTRLDGLSFAIVGRSFSEDPKLNWSTVYVSDRANEEQLRALTGLLEAGVKALGGRARHLAGSALGIRQAPITYEITADGRGHNARIPGILDLKTRSIILPGRTNPAVSSGIFDDYGDQFVHADCLAHRYHDSRIRRGWDLTARQANQADFTLNPERLAAGGIGWGCWSAHADFGSTERYQEQLIGHPDAPARAAAPAKPACCAPRAKKGGKR